LRAPEQTQYHKHYKQKHQRKQRSCNSKSMLLTTVYIAEDMSDLLESRAETGTPYTSFDTFVSKLPQLF